MTSAILTNKLLSITSEEIKNASELDPLVFGQKVNLVTKLFGCWHNNISRPFVQGKTAYRSCLHCGARKQFNTKTLETFGAFYLPPIVKEVFV